MTSFYLVLHFIVLDQDDDTVHAQIELTMDDFKHFLNVFGL